jgi:UDP-3-O-[3-hydroxymyristoyl] N-acetylglucosamine deacetylase/3-hydroxyacyl-[acyl-carrier-protein] dehydratase
LFTGFPVTMRFKPAPTGAGIAFVRTDQPGPVRIAARLENLTKRSRRTSLRNGTAAIETVEHLLAATRGVGVDNLIIELDNAEIPALDGSSQPFVDQLMAAGLEEQDADRTYIRVTEPMRVAEGDAELVAWPLDADRLEIIYELDYGADTVIGNQIHHFTLDPEGFREQIAPARTFVLEQEAQQLRAAGLGTHLSYEDILVIGPQGPIENAYRFENECVRHKILDLVGDLMLAGAFVCGRLYARKSGHHLNHELVRRLLDNQAREQFEDRLAQRPEIDIHGVRRVLPHRYPMLLVDRVIEIDTDRRAVGIKNVTINEPFFQGHYPRQPIMPGVLIIEAMAQLGGILMSQKLEHTGKVAVLLSLDKVKFRRPVIPGDQLVLEALAVRVKARTGQTQCRATVGGELVAEANIRFMLVDADPA